MLYVDIPTRPEIRALIAARADACVSIYVPMYRTRFPGHKFVMRRA